MHPIIEKRLATLERFLENNGLAIFDQKEIQHGHTVTVTDGQARVPINFYQTGKILIQGKNGPLQARLTEWKEEAERGGLVAPIAPQPSERLDRQTKFLVLPDKTESIRTLVQSFPDGDVRFQEARGAAEIYRATVQQAGQRISVTQYGSGTLLVQGRNSELFDIFCEYLDPHLRQSFSERASRYLPEGTRGTAIGAYLEGERAENEAVQWLHEQVSREALAFLLENDRHTLLSAAGLRNAVHKTNLILPDYSVIVMPFGKVFEGFMIRLAMRLELAGTENVQARADDIKIGSWLAKIREAMPDQRRYGDIYDALAAAWSARNKAVHSDPHHVFNVLKSSQEAEQEISTILRALGRAYRVFVEEGVQLKPDHGAPSKEQPLRSSPDELRREGVDRALLRARLEQDGLTIQKQKGQEWCIRQQGGVQVFCPKGTSGLVVVKGEGADQFFERYRDLLTPQAEAPEPLRASDSLRIGVDESGKGDYFGPLVVAAVALDAQTEQHLREGGVRDSKKLRDTQIEQLAELIRSHATVETLVLSPPKYNEQYELFGNLNQMLAVCHAEVIAQLHDRTGATEALSDQFGKRELLESALHQRGVAVTLEQRPGAESDVAVAAASIVARAAFVQALRDYSTKSGMSIPLGSSDQRIVEVGRTIYQRWGIAGLKRIAKLHFKTTESITKGQQ